MTFATMQISMMKYGNASKYHRGTHRRHSYPSLHPVSSFQELDVVASSEANEALHARIQKRD